MNANNNKNSNNPISIILLLLLIGVLGYVALNFNKIMDSIENPTNNQINTNTEIIEPQTPSNPTTSTEPSSPSTSYTPSTTTPSTPSTQTEDPQPTTPSTPSIKKYTLSYNANGGSVTPTSKTLNDGSSYGELPTPTRSGYTFTGWYTNSDGGSKVSKDTKITANTTLTDEVVMPIFEKMISDVTTKLNCKLRDN